MIVFLFNTASGLIFAALALFFSPEFWPFLGIPILAVLAFALVFRYEWRKHPGKTWSRTTIMMMIPEIDSIWSTGGAILYLLFYAAILLYPKFLFGAIFFSAFFIANSYAELGRFLARVVMRRRMQS